MLLIIHLKDKTADTYRNGRATVYVPVPTKENMLEFSKWEKLKGCMEDAGRLYRALGRCPGQLVPPLQYLTTTSTHTWYKEVFLIVHGFLNVVAQIVNNSQYVYRFILVKFVGALKCLSLKMPCLVFDCGLGLVFVAPELFVEIWSFSAVASPRKPDN